MGYEYLLVGNNVLYRLDYMGRELSRMIYGKGWKKMDGSDYFMFTNGGHIGPSSAPILRITKNLAIKITVNHGGYESHV